MSHSRRKTSGRRIGGQPGNKNALRHGFYSQLYTVADKKRLKDSIIEDEQALFRIKAYRLAELTPLNSGAVSDGEMRLLEILNLYGIAINTFERTILLARGHGGAIGDTILEALREMNPDEDLE